MGFPSVPPQVAGHGRLHCVGLLCGSVGESPWEWQSSEVVEYYFLFKKRGKFHWILCHLDEGSVNLFTVRCVYNYYQLLILTDLTDENWLYSLCIRVISMVRLSILLITLCISVEIEVSLFIAWRDSLFHGFLWFWQKVLGSRKHKSPYKSMYTWYIHDISFPAKWVIICYLPPLNKVFQLTRMTYVESQKMKGRATLWGLFGLMVDVSWSLLVDSWLVWYCVFWGEFSGYPGIPWHPSKPTTLKSLCTLHYEDFETSLNINMLEAWSHRLKLEKSSTFHTKNNKW